MSFDEIEKELCEFITQNSVVDDTYKFGLTQAEYDLANTRAKRLFFARCSKDSIFKQIDNAKNKKELEEITIKNYLCDVCDYEDLNIFAIKNLLKPIINCIYEYPKIRGRMSYIGSQKGYIKMLEKIRDYDINCIKSLALHYILTRENAVKYYQVLINPINDIMNSSEKYIALSLSTVFSLTDAIIFDENDYKGLAFGNLVNNMIESENTGFHPIGCHTAESVVYHELGHVLDNLGDISHNSNFLNFYNGLSNDYITKNVSIYATTSIQEFIAEAFSEYKCNSNPRNTAMMVAEFIKKLCS